MKTSLGQKTQYYRWSALMTFVLITLTALVDILLYAFLAEKVSFCTMLILNSLFVLVALSAYLTHLPFLDFSIAIVGVILFFLSVNFETSLFNLGFLILGVSAAAGATLSSVFFFQAKQKPVFPNTALISLVVMALLAISSLSGWGIANTVANNSTGFETSLYEVPSIYEQEDAQGGTLEDFSYTTQAYATDHRSLTKTATVYLPYGYEASQSYEILYLLHGTGDDETYWMKKFSYNKTLLDNLISRGLIAPLIVVMPTFYDGEDCLGDLDQLTYSFKNELRDDLLPAVESHYATYALSKDSAGFQASRRHRGFAGLSRGAVTTLRSACSGSLDYFSRFGLFSASRLDEADYQTGALGVFASFTIDYFYMSSGAFDFSLATQVNDYKRLLNLDSRLQEGVNCRFEVFPMRRHSMGSWHLALYNFLATAYPC